MTPNSPTWGDIRQFLSADRWREIPSNERGGTRSKHIFFDKVLEDGRVLETHVSHASDKTVSAGRFGEILRTQLEVSRADFWECVRSGTPVGRPVHTDPAPIEHPAWVVRVLVGELHMTAEEIGALTAQEAVERVNQHWQSS